MNYRLSPSEWLQRLRLSDAYERIVAGETVKSVSFSLGFKQLSHFSRAFKRHFGFPPKDIAPTFARRMPHFEYELESYAPRSGLAQGKTEGRMGGTH